MYRHLKPSKRNPQGGRLSKEMPVNASNVMFVDPATNQATRVGVRYLPDGSKELFAKKSKTRIRLLSKPDPKYATKK
jgi:large subunit ribosomal protein L24